MLVSFFSGRIRIEGAGGILRDRSCALKTFLLLRRSIVLRILPLLNGDAVLATWVPAVLAPIKHRLT